MNEDHMNGASDTSLVAGGQATWESILRAPGRGHHVAQLYTNSKFLVRAIGEYVAQGLRRGEAGLMGARPAHAYAITRYLEKEGLPVADYTRDGRLIVLDAEDTLSQFLIDGQPDRARFEWVIGRAVSVAKAAGGGRVRAFGEMVDLLRRTSFVATLRLEDLWTELLNAQGIALVCGYSIDAFDPGSYDGLLQRVTSAHSHLVPAEDYARLDRAVARAYVEIFGSEQDALVLRRAFLAHYARPAAMPDAQAAILAAREFVPSTAADLLVERVRHHYQNYTATAA
jgi:hypothetical protein